MAGPKASVAVRLEDGRVVIEHTCGGLRSVATLNNVDWTIVNEDPLEVRPSVACHDCNLHGWITGGEFWGSA